MIAILHCQYHMESKILSFCYLVKARAGNQFFNWLRLVLHSTVKKATQRTSSLNWPKELRAREVAKNFISYNPFFTLFIKPTHLEDCQAVGLNKWRETSTLLKS